MVPIVGQPQIRVWSITFNYKCTCGEELLWQGQVGTGCQCPKCKMILLLTAPPQPAANGKDVMFPLSMRLPPA